MCYNYSLYVEIDMKLIAMIFFILSSLWANDEIQNSNFQSYGHFKQMIKSRNISAKTTIDRLNLEKKGTFAVGALGSATGEITIFDSEIYLSYGKAGTANTLNHIPKGESAMLLALIRPKKFIKPIVIPEDMMDVDFYEWIEDQAKANDIDPAKPFLFILKGKFKELVWHIIHGRNIIPPKAGEKHYLMEKIFVRKEEEKGIIFGIYRKGEQGVFTHPGDNFHAHGIFANKTQAGHVDNFDLTKGVTLQLAQ
jgi:alpha-acetolactate decarboxylase